MLLNSNSSFIISVFETSISFPINIINLQIDNNILPYEKYSFHKEKKKENQELGLQKSQNLPLNKYFTFRQTTSSFSKSIWSRVHQKCNRMLVRLARGHQPKHTISFTISAS